MLYHVSTRNSPSFAIYWHDQTARVLQQWQKKGAILKGVSAQILCPLHRPSLEAAILMVDGTQK